ncbi:MAG: Replicative DNA helicase [Parcubacteria group bacterium GW2011_GWA2_47_8]|nr:MAG: Replicative DNA helicase [Parcubacteria group bacterium GW2011_GWA2_47_8]OHB20464.1 MAG: replicative DNA helicase [Parcubacteria group bacterium RIFCSPHIGHO2_01_FULL_47_10b]
MATQSPNIKYRTPPQDLEAEASVLGSLMMDKNAIIKVADWLESADFYRDIHRIIYEAIVSLYSKNEPIDILNVSSLLKSRKQLEGVGGSSFLAGLLNTVATPVHIEAYAKLVKNKRILRDLISAAGNIMELGYREDRKLEELVDEAEGHIYAVAKRSMREDFVHLKETLGDAFGRIDRLTNQEGGVYRGVPTGFTQLDNLLSGLQQSDLVILAARPSFGKTTLALDMARYAALHEKIPVALFSLEMSKEQLVDRLLSSVSGVSLWKLRTGRLSDRGANNDFTKLQQAFAILQDAPIYIDDAISSTVFQMKTLARRLQSRHGLGLVVVDYLQLMQAHTRSDSRAQEVSEISRGLKGLARELNVPVLALSQLSRAVEHRPTQVPRLADLRESGSIEQDADVVMFIYREDKVKEHSDRPNIADIIVAKHRNGPTGKIELYFDAENVRYTSLDTAHGEQQIPAGQGGGAHIGVPHLSGTSHKIISKPKSAGKKDESDDFANIIADLQ